MGFCVKNNIFAKLTAIKKTKKTIKNVSKIDMETRLQKDTTLDQFSSYFGLKNHEK